MVLIKTEVLQKAHEFWKEAKFAKNYRVFFDNLNRDMESIIHPKDRDAYNFSNKKILKSINGIVDDKKQSLLRPVVPQAFHISNYDLSKIKLVVLMKNPGLDTSFIGSDTQIDEQELFRKSLIGDKKFVPWQKETGWHARHFKPKTNSLYDFMKLEDEHIAQIEFFPYQSSDKSEIPNRFVSTSIENFKPLPSQEINFELFKYFLEKTGAIFIVRDWGIWNKLIINYLFSSDKNEGERYSKVFKERSFIPCNPQSFYLNKNIRPVIEEQEIEVMINNLIENKNT